jgi:hypothetical protein
LTRRVGSGPGAARIHTITAARLGGPLRDEMDLTNATFSAGTASVGTTAAVIVTLPAAGYNARGCLIKNAGTQTVYVGGPSVTATGATAGYPLSPLEELQLGLSNAPHDLYGIVPSGTGAVAYFFAAS